MIDLIHSVHQMRAAGLDLWVSSNGNLVVETLDAALLDKWRGFIRTNKPAICKALQDSYSPQWWTAPIEEWRRGRLTIKNIVTGTTSEIDLTNGEAGYDD